MGASSILFNCGKGGCVFCAHAETESKGRVENASIRSKFRSDRWVHFFVHAEITSANYAGLIVIGRIERVTDRICENIERRFNTQTMDTILERV